MSKVIGNILIYFMLSFAAPAVGAMRLMSQYDPAPVVLFSTGYRKRGRMLERRYGTYPVIRFMDFSL
jgi:hypothetical protein